MGGLRVKVKIAFGVWDSHYVSHGSVTASIYPETAELLVFLAALIKMECHSKVC
jgi:hypothetical protein